MRKTPLGLSLDLDDTLLDSSGLPESVARACRAVAQRFPHIDPQQLQRENDRAWRTYWPQVERACWLGQAGGYDISREVWRRALHALGCDDEAAVTEAFETLGRYGREASRLYSDVPRLLTATKRAGIPIAIVTNGASDLQRDKIEALGLQATKVIVISAEIRVAKPDPEIFYRAAADLGLDPKTMWHVGDNLVTDVAGAKAAGMTAVWLNRHNTQPPTNETPDIEVATLDEISSQL